MHCVLDVNNWGPDHKDLVAELPWMGEQRIFRGTLPAADWRHLYKSDLPDPEQWADIAIQRLTVDAYSGVVIGHAIRAIPRDKWAPDRLPVSGDLGEYSIGMETATIGLFFWYNGTEDETEPIVRFGRLAMVPQEPIRGMNGMLMRALLVESHASAGMSGSPVFIDSDQREPELLGIHVGHARAPRKDIASTEHSGVAFVAPTSRLRTLLDRSDVAGERWSVEEEWRNHPWRFRDRRHRTRRGVALREELFPDELEYLEEHPHMFEHLLLKPTNPGHRYMVEDYWNEWTAQPIAYADILRQQIELSLASVRAQEAASSDPLLRWREHPYRWFGWGEWQPSGAEVETLHVSIYLMDEEQGIGDASAIVVEAESVIADHLLRGLAQTVGATRAIVPHSNTAMSI